MTLPNQEIWYINKKFGNIIIFLACKYEAENAVKFMAAIKCSKYFYAAPLAIWVFWRSRAVL